MGTLKSACSQTGYFSPLIPGMTKMSRRTSEKEGFLGVDGNFRVPKGWRREAGKPDSAPRFTQKSEARSSRSGLLGSWARESPETRAKPDCRCGWLSLARVRSIALLLVQACCPDALLAGIACMLTVSSGTLVRLRGTLDMLLPKLAESRRPH